MIFSFELSLIKQSLQSVTLLLGLRIVVKDASCSLTILSINQDTCFSLCLSVGFFGTVLSQTFYICTFSNLNIKFNGMNVASNFSVSFCGTYNHNITSLIVVTGRPQMPKIVETFAKLMILFVKLSPKH